MAASWLFSPEKMMAFVLFFQSLPFCINTLLLNEAG
jgi:hypothetical protein